MRVITLVFIPSYWWPLERLLHSSTSQSHIVVSMTSALFLNASRTKTKTINKMEQFRMTFPPLVSQASHPFDWSSTPLNASRRITISCDFPTDAVNSISSACSSPHWSLCMKMSLVLSGNWLLEPKLTNLWLGREGSISTWQTCACGCMRMCMNKSR